MLEKKTCHHIDYDLINTENSFFFFVTLLKMMHSFHFFFCNIYTYNFKWDEEEDAFA